MPGRNGKGQMPEGSVVVGVDVMNEVLDILAEALAVGNDDGGEDNLDVIDTKDELIVKAKEIMEDAAVGQSMPNGMIDVSAMTNEEKDADLLRKAREETW